MTIKTTISRSDSTLSDVLVSGFSVQVIVSVSCQCLTFWFRAFQFPAGHSSCFLSTFDILVSGFHFRSYSSCFLSLLFVLFLLFFLLLRFFYELKLLPPSLSLKIYSSKLRSDTDSTPSNGGPHFAISPLNCFYPA